MTADEKNKMYQDESKDFIYSDKVRKVYSKDEIREEVIEYVKNHDQKIDNIFSNEHYKHINDLIDQFNELTPHQKKVYTEYITKKAKNIGGQNG
jgi:DNA-directed RNA polymerase delta subunit